jgi:hypothetical protein
MEAQPGPDAVGPGRERGQRRGDLVPVFRNKQQGCLDQLSAVKRDIRTLSIRVDEEIAGATPDVGAILDLLARLMSLEAERSRLQQELAGTDGLFFRGGYLERVREAQKHEARARQQLGFQRVEWLARQRALQHQ